MGLCWDSEGGCRGGGGGTGRASSDRLAAPAGCGPRPNNDATAGRLTLEIDESEATEVLRDHRLMTLGSEHRQTGRTGTA